MTKLISLELSGFKSIKRLPRLLMSQRNVLIGPNGAGKSNLISFFRLLSWMLTGELQYYVAQKGGGASALLHDGPARTPQIEARLSFETEQGINEYHIRLFHAAGDTLVFAEEEYRFSRHDHPAESPKWQSLGAGHKETRLIEVAESGNKTASTLRYLLRQCVIYQFHNTSETARIRQKWPEDDDRFLKEDGANLAPFLLRLRESAAAAYRRIVETVRQIVPFFGEFVLEPTGGTLNLRWRERNSDVVFGPHQASDGTLRTIALIALLLQPTEDIPAVVILDEPELGLHPSAINVIAGLIRSVSLQRQVLLATQSMSLVDYFDAEDVIIVDRRDRDSEFRRLDIERLQEWLEEYSLGELWEKNVLGGRPV